MGVGIPVYFMIYLGLAGLELIPSYFDYSPDRMYAVWFLGFGIVGTSALLFKYTNGTVRHKRHCEITSYAECAIVAGLILSVILYTSGKFMTYDIPILFAISMIAGTIGLVLYRMEKKKPILPT